MNRALKQTLLVITALTLLTTTKHLSAQTKSFETAVVRPCAPDADPNTGSWSPPGRNRFVATTSRWSGSSCSPTASTPASSRTSQAGSVPICTT